MIDRPPMFRPGPLADPHGVPPAGLDWVRSSRSQAQNNNCVELAAGPAGTVVVRDSKDPHGAVLTLSPRAWHAFVSALKGS